MNAERRSPPAKRIAERTFPHRVDIPVPPFGLGRRINDMVEWCQARAAADQWALHSWQERRGARVDPRDWARFYFLDAALADAFRRRWGE